MNLLAPGHPAKSGPITLPHLLISLSWAPGSSLLRIKPCSGLGSIGRNRDSLRGSLGPSLVMGSLGPARVPCLGLPLPDCLSHPDGADSSLQLKNALFFDMPSCTSTMHANQSPPLASNFLQCWVYLFFIFIPCVQR